MIEKMRRALAAAGVLAATLAVPALGWGPDAEAAASTQQGIQGPVPAPESTGSAAGQVDARDPAQPVQAPADPAGAAAERADPGGIPGGDMVGGVLVPETGGDAIGSQSVREPLPRGAETLSREGASTSPQQAQDDVYGRHDPEYLEPGKRGEWDTNFAWLALLLIPFLVGGAAVWWMRQRGTPRERHPAP
ncbi:MAG: hypothetical protein ACK47B_03185 [Armatimonadota bacterium]